jgi:hypothetical protein
MLIRLSEGRKSVSVSILITAQSCLKPSHETIVIRDSNYSMFIQDVMHIVDAESSLSSSCTSVLHVAAFHMYLGPWFAAAPLIVGNQNNIGTRTDRNNAGDVR